MFGNRHPASERLRGLMNPTCTCHRQRNGDCDRVARTVETRIVSTAPIRNMRKITKVKNDARLQADTARADSDEFVSGVVVVRPRELKCEMKTNRAFSPRFAPARYQVEICAIFWQGARKPSGREYFSA